MTPEQRADAIDSLIAAYRSEAKKLGFEPLAESLKELSQTLENIFPIEDSTPGESPHGI